MADDPARKNSIASVALGSVKYLTVSLVAEKSLFPIKQQLPYSCHLESIDLEDYVESENGDLVDRKYIVLKFSK